MCETSLGNEKGKEGAEGGEEVGLHLHLAQVRGQEGAGGRLQGYGSQDGKHLQLGFGCGHCNYQQRLSGLISILQLYNKESESLLALLGIKMW